jgi:hypothetical protein
MSNLKQKSSIFKGTLSARHFDNYPGIALADDNGFRIDLIARCIEIEHNYRWSEKYKVSLFIADSKTPYSEIEDNWTQVIEGSKFFVERRSYDVEYFSDWQETKYITEWTLNGFDLFEELKKYAGKWAYIKIDVFRKEF